MKKRYDENEDGAEQRKGPWTLEEDTLLTNYIAKNGEGRWSLLAKSSGLKRKGKSCRLRWLNYLKPDIKRGNLTPQEQLLILELHSKWGNRWSKIARYLPGRTDNEIKNYWRTRVQKQARLLNVDSSSHEFLEAVSNLWVQRLIHKDLSNTNTNTNTKAPPPVLRDNDDLGFNNSIDDCSTSVYADLKRVSQLMDVSDMETTTTGAVYLDGPRGSSSSSQCVSEDYNTSSFHCLEEDYIVATMGNSYVSPFQDCHVGDSSRSYEEDVTQDPMWNIDDIWQFKDYAHSN